MSYTDNLNNLDTKDSYPKNMLILPFLELMDFHNLNVCVQQCLKTSLIATLSLLIAIYVNIRTILEKQWFVLLDDSKTLPKKSKLLFAESGPSRTY